MQRYTDLAVIVGTKNLDGRSVLQGSTDLPFFFQPGLEVHFIPPVVDCPRSAVVEDASLRPDGKQVVRFDAVDDIDTANMLVGCHVIAKSSDVDVDLLSDLGIDGYIDFTGWTLEDEVSGRSGTVVSVSENFDQLLLEVEDQDGEMHLVPLADDLLSGIDEDSRCMRVSLPEGIFDL